MLARKKYSKVKFSEKVLYYRFKTCSKNDPTKVTSIQLAKDCLLGITPKSAVFSVFDMLKNREQSKMIAKFSNLEKKWDKHSFLSS